MEALSIALVLIFIMWLIDKHAAWKTAGKFALIVVGLAVLGVGSFYGWNRYQERKRDDAERKKHATFVAACMIYVYRVKTPENRPRDEAPRLKVNYLEADI